jgi:MarR family 2-MHQ and catechol resistance regulon transcriptional repressor
MEAATKSQAKASSRGATSDRELALRLGSLMLCSFGSDGGSVIRAIDETGLSFTQMKALVTLAGRADEQPATVNQVAEGLGISLASASRAVDGLVKRALATRVEDPEDRRVRRVSLTADGQLVADELMAARLEGLERFVETLRTEERRKLEAALEVLLERDDIAGIYRTHRKRAFK